MDSKGHTYKGRRRKKRILFFVILLLAMAGTVHLWFSGDFKHNDKAEQVNDSKTIISEEIINGIHQRTGLKEGEGLMTVVTNCTACHSAQLIIQNRMNRERWNATIRWMQETQNLWELGTNQEVIVNYLLTNYPVIHKGRREKLENIEWYVLEEQIK